jgi:hypothetical protein
MNNRTIVGLSLILSLSGMVAQTSFAQIQRYPTPAEAETAIARDLLPSMPERLQQPAYTDRRTPQQIQELQDFRQAWSQISPETALFLGEWHGSSQGSDIFVAVYPSNHVSGRVCVLQYIESTQTYNFGVGLLVPAQAQINVTGGEDFVMALRHITDIAGEHMAQVAVNRISNLSQAGGHVAFPRPLRDPSSFVPEQVQSSISLQNYDIANCTTGLPEFRTGTLPNHPLTGEDSREGVIFRFTGAYVSSSSTSQSVEAYWEIENLSDRRFGIYPPSFKIETADGQEIECPNIELPENFPLSGTGCVRALINEGYSPVVEPGGSITGRIIILRRVSELEELFLVFPEATPGGQLFRVPIHLGDEE